MHSGVFKLGNLLLICGVLGFGCSPKPLESWSPDDLARRIASSDHVIASDLYRGSLLVLSGEDASRLLRAVSEAKGAPKMYSAATAPVCKLEFYRQTNLLASIMAQDKWFQPLDLPGEFTDPSGVLKALQLRLQSDDSAKEAWVYVWARGLLSKPEFASLSDWSLALMGRYEAGTLLLGKHDDGPTGVAIPQREIPGWLQMFEAYIHKDPAGRPECVIVSWERYGLVFSPTNQPTTFRAGYMTNLGPGITAYHAGK